MFFQDFLVLKTLEVISLVCPSGMAEDANTLAGVELLLGIL